MDATLTRNGYLTACEDAHTLSLSAMRAKLATLPHDFFRFGYANRVREA